MHPGTPSSESPTLRLLPATEATLLWELCAGRCPDALCGVVIPASWPPADYDLNVIRKFLGMTQEPGQFYFFYWIAAGGPDDNTLVGSGGFILSESGDYELGYAVAEACRNKGYAAEGVRAIVAWLRDSGYQGRIIATTQATNDASVQVLENNGFTRTEPQADTDLIGFECR